MKDTCMLLMLYLCMLTLHPVGLGWSRCFLLACLLAKNICSNQDQLDEELTYIDRALTACNYPSWAIERMKFKEQYSITVPYNKGLSESFKNIGKKYGIQVHFKSGKTLKDELVAPKDKDNITKKSGIIYRFKYIGETSRTFGREI